MTLDQLEVLRDMFQEWDDDSLMRKIVLSFEDVSNTVHIVIDDCDEQDYKDLKDGTL